ncbi:MAG: sugar phosphate nucleotidyltransferase [Bacillota bacterium]
MKAVIMAGGEGSRLRPLTCDKPKPMVPVMNRPLMEYSVELLRRHDFYNIAVTLQYLPEQIKDHFGDGSRFGVNFRYYIEEEPLGTAGSVKNAASFLDETFIVISGDALTDFDLTGAVEFHRARGALATLVLKSVESPLEYGVVMIEPDGRITRFLEKPGWGEVFSDTVNTGIYILEPEVLSLVEPGKMVDFSKDIFPLLLKQGDPLFGCVLDGFWCDIGDLKEYLRAHRQVLEGQVDLRLNAREAEKGIWLEDGVQVHPRAQLQAPLYLGRGCTIGATAQVKDGAVLGSYTRVDERASVKRGLTWEGAYIGKGAALRGGILCQAVQLNARSSVFEEAVIGDGSIIQEGVVVKPGVKVWPGKVLENGVILYESLIWGNKASRSIFGRDGIRGDINRNITPEMMLRLGAVYGSIVNSGAVLVSGDAGKSSVMLRKALIAGLLSTGAYVLDAGELLIPMARRAVSYLKAKGGIHVSLAAAGSALTGGNISPAAGVSFNGLDAAFSEGGGAATDTRISFFESDGLPLSRTLERKIEQLYLREDFHRPAGDAIGEALRLSNLAELYRRELIRNITASKIARAGFRVVLGDPSPYLRRFLVPLLQQLHCTVITINAGLEAANTLHGGASLQWRRKEVAQAVRANNASLGVIIEPGGEKALLFDERGRVIQGDLYTALLSLLVFREHRGSTVAVPVNVSHVVEKLADRYHGRVLRTKASPRHLMETGPREPRHRRPAMLHFDGVAALIHLLDLLAAQDITLNDLLAEIPAIRVREKEIPCPWTHKGRVMRRLIQESRQNRTEMIDGLKVYHPQGWALIMPDPEKPSYHVYSEGFSEEVADSLTEFYIDKISILQREP